MTKGTAIFLIGLLLIIVPSLGIPLLWKHGIYVAFGILLLAFGYTLRRRQYLDLLEQDGETRTRETFVETTEPLFDAGTR
jgi:hypothetical protein